MLCSFLLHSKVNEAYIYVYHLFFRLPSPRAHHNASGRAPCPSTSLHMTQFHSFLWLSNNRCIYIYHIFFIHSSLDGHLGCFQVLTIVNSAAMKPPLLWQTNLSMFPSYFLLGAVLVLKLWLLPQCEGRSSARLQTHHMRNESLAYLFPGWVRDLWVQTAASRGFFPSPSLMQWTIKWYVFLERSGLSHTTFRVHVEKLRGQLLPFRMWLEELGGWLKLLQCWQASLSPTHTQTCSSKD